MNSIKSFFSKVKSGGSLKYIIPGMLAVVLIAIVIGNYLRPDKALGSVYSIEQANQDIGSIRVGDTINYEINGYSDWQVLHVDRENGLVDVVSKSNTENLEINSFSADDYLNKLQERASRYVDNVYAVRARSINESEIDLVASNEDYWVAKADDFTFKTNNGEFRYNNYNPDLYVLPYVVLPVQLSEIYSYNAGDRYSYSINGIDDWIIMEVNGASLTITMVPATPIKINYNNQRSNYDVGNEIINSYRVGNVQSVGNAFDKYSNSQVANALNGFFNNLKNVTYFVYQNNGNISNREYDDYYEYRDSACYQKIDSDGFNSCREFVYKMPKPKTYGFRPVVTLQLSKKEITTELSSGIKIGDYIKYEASGYNSWRVLSIDEEKGTVDLVSGGIVRNIVLTGDDGYNNLSQILQDEVSSYGVGKDVVGVRPLDKSDLSNLSMIKDEVNAKYWINSKRSTKKVLESNYYANFYSVLTGFHNGDEVDAEYIYLFIGSNIDSVYDFHYNFNYYIGVDTGINNYTAGIRPVVTVKVDSLKKLSTEEAKKVEKSSIISDKSYANEQANNNKNYTVTNKSITDSTSSNKYYTKNDDVIETNEDTVNPTFITSKSDDNNSTCSSCLCKGYLRYVILCLIILIIVGISIAVFLGLIYRKIDKLYDK